MFVPVLPTTPFLLLTAYCYLRSSQRMYGWVMKRRIIGNYIRNYLEYRAVSARAKAVSLAGLWASLAISFILVDSAIVRGILVLVGAGVTIHLLTIKTLPKEARQNGKKKQREFTPNSQ